ncbi:MAG: hypothetical protein ABJA02_07960 [Acidobacteriota bacterium]
MNSERCNACGSLNPTSVAACRRCGAGYTAYRPPPSPAASPREAARRSSWLYTLLFLALLGGGAYYLYSGFLRSFEQVQSNENYVSRPAAAPTSQRMSNRTESDRQRVTPFKTAIQNSPGLTEANRRLAETQKLMQPTR